LTGITNTTVVNLGGSNDDRNDEEDKMGQSNANNVPAQTNNAMEKTTTNRMWVKISSKTKKVLFAEKQWRRKIASKKNLQ